ITFHCKFYFISYPELRLNNNIGAVQKAITIDYLKKVKITLPDLPTQQKIASVLSALDDKIELNNRINAELEAMAKTLYDYWFVQFDFPTHSHCEERGTRDEAIHNKQMASLHEVTLAKTGYKSSGGKMVYNETLKREIPEGWEVKNIKEVCEIVDCLHSKKPEYKFEDENFYLLQLENLLDNGLIDTSKKYFVSEADYKNWTNRITVKEHDILFTNAGRVAQTTQLSKEIVSGIGRNITAVRPINISPTFCFLSINSYDVQKQIFNNIDQGAFFQSFNVKGIKLLNFIVPPKDVQVNFEKIVYNIRRKRELNLKQNQELSAL
uniref:restriction endonuclease subunit S n=1 Tax=Epilithonimonas sp. TaxID=2894511 RepID=UPI0028973E85